MFDDIEIGGKRVDEYLKDVNYSVDPDYVPSEFALEMLAFIKLVNGEQGEENKTPVSHLKMLDTMLQSSRITNLCHRGIAKTTIMGEYLFLYLGVYGELPGFGPVPYALYISDSVENGVKKMRLRLERRWENSPFLQKYIPKVKFTDIRWYFKNAEGNEFVVTGHGAKTGVRGTVELNTRPHLAVLDDLLSDEDARSATVVAAVEETVHKAVNFALHPKHNMIVWSGTPFNAKDPLYKAVESGAWAVNVFPVCEHFPCEEEDFRGSWEDRFDYDYVATQFKNAVKQGRVDTFNQELMLRIMSDDERLIQDHEIVWYDLEHVLANRSMFNFYITTDFAVSDKDSRDFSVLSVWALTNKGQWLYVDGVCRRQTMDKNIDDLFRLAQKWNPQSVGIEISGQQAGFIPWIQSEMLTRNIYFTLASDKAGGSPGIRPTTNKIMRFNVMVPLFKQHKVWFPTQLRGGEALKEAYDELTLATVGQFKSKHDDFIDTISMLANMNAWRPSEEAPVMMTEDSKYWLDEQPEYETNTLDSYLV